MDPHFFHSIQCKKAKPGKPMPGPLLHGITIAVLLTFTCDSTMAQDAGTLLQEKQWQQQMQQPERLPQPEPLPGKQIPPAQQETGETFFVKELRFTGKVGLLPVVEQRRFAAAIQNKHVGMSDLQALTDEVTFTLQKQDHLLARAALPPQDVTAGIVIVAITEGRLARIDIERGKGARIREELLRAIGENHVQADKVSKESLEEALLLMNDLPGVTARGSIGPGMASNTSRLVVGVEQAPIVSASLAGDNHGSPSTGHAQSNTLVTLTDLTGLGDQTRFIGSLSEAQKFGQAEASFPLNASGFTAHISYAYLAYRNTEEIGRLARLEGFAHHVESGLDYPLIRSRRLNLRLSTELNLKALVDTSIAGRLQDKRVRSGNVTLIGDLQDEGEQGALTKWSLGWIWGDLDLSRAPSAQAVDAASLQTQGNYQRLNAGLARLQPLAKNFSLSTHIYGQWANKNLDSSEDFALGGPYGVRGWPIGEGRGDMGLSGTIELRYTAPVPAPWGKIQLSSFLDGGRVWVNKNSNGVPLLTACGCNTYHLAGAGIGIRWIRENLSITATYAQGIGDNPGRSSTNGASANDRAGSRQFWLQSAIQF